MAATALLFTIFGMILLYLLGSGLYFAFYSDAPAVEDDLVEFPSKRCELLALVRAFLKRHDISEEWLLHHGLEKEALSAVPGSIFGRMTRRQEFGHKLSFTPLERASDEDLRRILLRGSALIRYRDGTDCCRMGKRKGGADTMRRQCDDQFLHEEIPGHAHNVREMRYSVSGPFGAPD